MFLRVTNNGLVALMYIETYEITSNLQFDLSVHILADQA
jgi:hypothetical protein